MRPRILLADDHAMLLDAFRSLLEPEFEVVGAVTDGRAALEATSTLDPDVAVLDVGMPVMNGLEAGRRIKQDHPRTKVVYLTVSQEPGIIDEAFRAGASGYVPKGLAAGALFRTIRDVLDGKTVTPDGEAPQRKSRGNRLTARQREVLSLLAKGLTMKQAAAELGVSARTIAFHKYRAMAVLGLQSSADLVRFAVAQQMVDA